MSGSDQANMASTSTTTTSVGAESVFISAACNSFSQCLAWAKEVLPVDKVRHFKWNWVIGRSTLPCVEGQPLIDSTAYMVVE